MNTHMKSILAVMLGLGVMAGSMNAVARDGHDWRHDGDRGRHEQRWDGHQRHDHRYWDDHRYPYRPYFRDRVIVRPAPPVYYAPPYYYGYPRYYGDYYGEPSVVINVPPFVFSLD
jgi:hypothetical protein